MTNSRVSYCNLGSEVVLGKVVGAASLGQRRVASNIISALGLRFREVHVRHAVSGSQEVESQPDARVCDHVHNHPHKRNCDQTDTHSSGLDMVQTCKTHSQQVWFSLCVRSQKTPCTPCGNQSGQHMQDKAAHRCTQSLRPSRCCFQAHVNLHVWKLAEWGVVLAYASEA